MARKAAERKRAADEAQRRRMMEDEKRLVQSQLQQMQRPTNGNNHTTHAVKEEVSLERLQELISEGYVYDASMGGYILPPSSELLFSDPDRQMVSEEQIEDLKVQGYEFDEVLGGYVKPVEHAEQNVSHLNVQALINQGYVYSDEQDAYVLQE